MQQHIIQVADGLLLGGFDPAHVVELCGGFVAKQQRGKRGNGKLYRLL